MYRELFTIYIFGRPVVFYSYGLFLSLALVLGILVFYKLAKKKGLNTSHIFDNIVVVILVGLICAKIGYVLLHLDYYASHWLDALKIWQPGLAFYGAFLGGLLITIIWFAREERKNLWKWLDTAIPALVLGNGIGKIGCFLNGCCYGRESNILWAVKIPVLEDNIPRHPVQIYEALAYILVFVILIILEFSKVKKLKSSEINKERAKRVDVILVSQKRFKFDGFVFFLGLILHSLARFSLEFYREWIITFKIATIEFTDAQLICSIILICAIIGMVLRLRSARSLINQATT